MVWKTLICSCHLKTLQRRYISSLFRKKSEGEVYDNVVDGLKSVYKNKLLPIEEMYLFHDFHSPRLFDSDFEAKPLILLMGQYSTGKTTLIKYLLGCGYPGMRIGPEPTTDRFIAVMHGQKDGVIPGNALVVDPKKHFTPLSKYGNNFLNRFQCSTTNSDVLKSMSIIDTPGILSGEKQRIDRGYDFTGVLEWFAERVDRIILLFDANKLDISDEFRNCIDVMKAHDDKIRIILNKADMVNHQQLMRVYGALMWSLGKIVGTPETARVYIGSFWDEPLRFDTNRRLFEDEEQDLFKDLQSLPRNATLRKINDLSKRARLAKVQAILISSLYNEMPSLFGKDTKKKELIDSLSDIYKDLQSKYQLSGGDFPDLKKMQESLRQCDFKRFQPLRLELVSSVDQMLAEDIAHLMSIIPLEDDESQADISVQGGAFKIVDDKSSPFGYKQGDGFNEGIGETDWVVNKYRQPFDDLFKTFTAMDGKISRTDAKNEMMKSKLPNPVLGQIWHLGDVDKDGFLDADEFALVMYLINIRLKGYELPNKLPDHLIPPSKQKQVQDTF